MTPKKPEDYEMTAGQSEWRHETAPLEPVIHFGSGAFCSRCGNEMTLRSVENGIPRYECFYPDCPLNLKGKPDNSGVGCGVWPVLLKNTRFYPACEWHDVATMDNSPQSKMFARWKIDRTFLSHMLDIAGDSKWHRARARVFYGIARAFSWVF